MKSRYSLWTLAALGGLVPLAGLSLWAAEPVFRRPTPGPAGPETTGAAPREKAGGSSSGTPTTDDEHDLNNSFMRLEVQSAEAYLKLTELDLRKVTEMNEKMANVYSGSVVDDFKAAVEIAKERVNVARQALAGTKETSLVGIASIRLKTAQQGYERAQNANRRVPGTYGPIDVERLQVSVDSARVDLDKAKIVSRMDSPLTDLHLELDQLREEVRALRYKITAITSRR
jgi:hypothetical protein